LRKVRKDFRTWPDPEAPTAGPAGPLTEVDLPCRASERLVDRVASMVA